MNQLTLGNVNASGVATEWDFGSYEYLEEEASTGCSTNSTTEENNNNEYVPGTFEGPEKTLEVIFKHGEGLAGGLRNMNRPQLDELCTRAKCTILSSASTNHVDAYVLSESSLFVYEYRLIMKTCGTTTLLRCLGTLFEYSDKLGMQLSWVGYSRKNFLFPSAQLWPHVNFGEEMRYIEQHESLQKRLRGDGHILGPVTGDHWFVYVAEGVRPSSQNASPVTTPGAISAFASMADLPSHMATRASNESLVGLPQSVSASVSAQIVPPPRAASPSCDSTSGEDEECDKTERARPVGKKPPCATFASSELTAALNQMAIQRHSTYRTFNMMMFDMHPEVAATFFQGTNNLTGKEMTAKAGIPALCPGAVIDEAAFTPCGYSMNAVLDDCYSTIHITPEAACSYVSFETNTQMEDYAPLLRRVLETFRPQRFVLTMFGDDDAVSCLARPPTANRCYSDIAGCPEGAQYVRTSLTATVVEAQRQQCIMGCYSYQAPVPQEFEAAVM